MHLNINKLIEIIVNSHFTLLILVFLEVAALILAIINIRKQPVGVFFIFYLAFDLSILLIDLLIDSSNIMRKSVGHKFIVSSNTFIGMIELVVYYNYFKTILSLKKLKNKLSAIQFAYIIIAICFISLEIYFESKQFDYFSYLLGVLEFTLLIPPCIIYFRQILNVDSNVRLFDRSSFWIITGIFFYAAVSIPFYLLKKYLDNVHYEFKLSIAAAFYYTPMIINVGFLTFVFRWKKQITI